MIPTADVASDRHAFRGLIGAMLEPALMDVCIAIQSNLNMRPSKAESDVALVDVQVGSPFPHASNKFLYH